jgi:peptide/nickel transport system permease protein
MKLRYYIFQRLITLIPVVLLAITIIFFISHIIPGDPARLLAGEHAGEEQVQKIKEEYNLDKPVPEQYYLYLRDSLRGEFGRSMHTRRDVMEDIKEYYPATLELATLSMILIIVVGIPLGVISAVNRNKLLDHIARIIAIGGVAMPVFWLAVMLQILLYYKFSLFPIGARITYGIPPPESVTGFYTIDSILAGDWTAFKSSIHHIILPSLCLAFSSMSSVVRQTRGEMLKILKEDYITAHKAYGIKNRRVIYLYGLKNALIPTVSLIGLVFGVIISRSFLVEIVFAWPGIGSYVVQSILTLDFPAIVGSVLIIAITYILINLIVDIVYTFLNPKIQL